MPNTSALITKQNVSTPSTSNPHLAKWVKELAKSTRTLNPVIAQNILHLLHDDDCDSNKLAQLIKQDPVLSLQLFTCAETMLKSREGEVQHIVHLISLIGLNAIEKTILRHNKKSALTNMSEFNELLSASLFAAHIASDLLTTRHNASSDRFFMPALLFNAPLLAMWMTSPKRVQETQKSALQTPHHLPSICRKKLGFTVNELYSAADSFLLLPTLSQKALAIPSQQDNHFWAKALRCEHQSLARWFKKDTAAKMHFYSLEMGIYLINQYVLAIYLDKSDKYIRRYSKLLSHYLQIDEHDLKTQCMDLALTIELPKTIKTAETPIYRLREQHKEGSHEIKATKTASTLPQHMKKHLHKIRHCTSINTALDAALQACKEGIGAEHCVVIEVEDNEMHTQGCYGFNEQSAMYSFHHDRESQKDHHPDLFNQLIQKPACLIIPSHNLPKAAKKMPQPFTDACELKPCALLSVFYHEQPKALIYCDHEDWDSEKHAAFKVIGKQLSITLQQI